MSKLSQKRRAQEILARRQANRPPPFKLETFLFKEQIDFVLDPARYAVACCSVRSGKTMACAADLMHTAITTPGTTSLYITLARTSAKSIIWPELKKINRDYKLNGKENESELTIHFPNDSWIRLFGGNESTEIEKIRGLSNCVLIYLDECQAFRAHIRELVEDIVAKRLYDTNGRCRMIGTPGPIEAGFFLECYRSPTWSRHHWTMHVNPWLLKKSGKTPQELIDADCKRKGVTTDDPSIQRECYGRWVRDPEALLLNYNTNINDYDTLPNEDWKYLLGIDIGYDDADSLTVLAYTETSPVTWLVEEIVTPNSLIGTLAQQIQELDNKYHFRQMVADTGGVGKKVIQTLIFQYSLLIEPADKTGKIADYGLLNNALRTGNFRAKKDSRFAQDCNILKKDKNKSTPDRIVVEGHSDPVDSCLYAFSLSPAYDFVPKKVPAKPGTMEYEQEQSQLHQQAIVEYMQREQAGKDGGRGWIKDKDGNDPWNKW